MRRAIAVFSALLVLIASMTALSVPTGGAENAEPVPHEEIAEETYDPAWDVPASECAYIDCGEPLGEFALTAYCPCSRCCGKSDGITATGTNATAGRTIAVDPSVIPYGSEVTIFFEEGDTHTYIAEDCGGSIKKNRIDIFFDSHDEALIFGVQSAMVYVKVN